MDWLVGLDKDCRVVNTYPMKREKFIRYGRLKMINNASVAKRPIKFFVRVYMKRIYYGRDEAAKAAYLKDYDEGIIEPKTSITPQVYRR